MNMGRVADHWNQWRLRRTQQIKHASTNYVDWGDHPVVLECIFQHAFGDRTKDPFQFLVEQYPQVQQAHVLSLCCGDASFESALLARGVFSRVTGFDLSGQSIELINQATDRLQVKIADVNTVPYGQHEYDVVFAKAALHHIERLEYAFDEIKRCLKPGGLLVTLDFFGPSRFQWTDAQLQACHWFWEHRVPAELRREQDGSETPNIQRMNVADLVAMDPSEAVRSGELYDLLRQNFEILCDVPLGGTVLNLLLYGERVNRFNAQNPAHCALIREAHAFELDLISRGALASDFRFIVARPA